MFGLNKITARSSCFALFLRETLWDALYNRCSPAGFLCQTKQTVRCSLLLCCSCAKKVFGDLIDKLAKRIHWSPRKVNLHYVDQGVDIGGWVGHRRKHFNLSNNSSRRIHIKGCWRPTSQNDSFCKARTIWCKGCQSVDRTRVFQGCLLLSLDSYWDPSQLGVAWLLFWNRYIVHHLLQIWPLSRPLCLWTVVHCLPRHRYLSMYHLDVKTGLDVDI